MQAGESQPMPDDAPAGDVTFACQECGRSITFAEDRRGHVETCPNCGSPLTLEGTRCAFCKVPLVVSGAGQVSTDVPAAGIDPDEMAGAMPKRLDVFIEQRSEVPIALVDNGGDNPIGQRVRSSPITNRHRISGLEQISHAAEKQCCQQISKSISKFHSGGAMVQFSSLVRLNGSRMMYASSMFVALSSAF